MPDNVENKRDFERYPLGFETDIYTHEATEKQPVERVTLKDISGDGACFLSSSPGLYATGQKISLGICLPNTSGANAHMRGQATIVRVDDPEVNGTGEPQHVEIGISMDELLSFQQEPGGMNPGEEALEIHHETKG